jgi:hypothetical protein
MQRALRGFADRYGRGATPAPKLLNGAKHLGAGRAVSLKGGPMLFRSGDDFRLKLVARVDGAAREHWI